MNKKTKLTDKTILQLKEEIIKIRKTNNDKKHSTRIDQTKSFKDGKYSIRINIKFDLKDIKEKQKNDEDEEDEE